MVPDEQYFFVRFILLLKPFQPADGDARVDKTCMVFTGIQLLGRDERLAVCGVFNFFAGEVLRAFGNLFKSKWLAIQK